MLIATPPSLLATPFLLETQERSRRKDQDLTNLKMHNLFEYRVLL